jgi:Skp family chaperone for outer membrane proteins
VKRTALGIVAGVAVLGIGVYLGSQGWAQQGNYTQTRPPLQSKIALVNLGQVIKNYKKYQQFLNDVKQQSQDLQKGIDGKKAQAIAFQKEMENPQTAPARRDELEREVKNLQRSMQDSVDDAKQKLQKQEYDELVKTHKEVREAVEAYARAYAIELVFQYNDGVGAEMYLPAHFTQKITNKACMPLYIDPRMDITEGVTTMLNQKLAQAAPTAPRG